MFKMFQNNGFDNDKNDSNFNYFSEAWKACSGNVEEIKKHMGEAFHNIMKSISNLSNEVASNYSAFVEEIPNKIKHPTELMSEGHQLFTKQCQSMLDANNQLYNIVTETCHKISEEIKEGYNKGKAEFKEAKEKSNE